MLSSVPRRTAPQWAHRNAVAYHRLSHVLFVSSIRQDRAHLRHILSPEYRTIVAGSCREALSWLARGRISVVLSDCSLTDGNWREVLSCASALTDPAPVIVVSDLTDSRLWAEVLNLGGYDLIAKPFHAEEVRHVVKSALIRKMPHAVGCFTSAY